MIRALRIMTLVLLAGAIALGVTRSVQRPDEPERFGPIGSFRFTDSAGNTFTDADVRGKVVVFACFFTCCTEFCPALSGTMARLQGELRDVPNMRLISLSVDPDTDTPEKLTKYAEAFGAEPSRWTLLTGPRDAVEPFVRTKLHQAVEENKAADRTAGTKMLHSNKLVLVDGDGEVRGFFDGTQADEVDKLKVMIRLLSGLSRK